MDIWTGAALLAWLPVAAAIAVLVGRSIARADASAHREQRPSAATSSVQEGPFPVVADPPQAGVRHVVVMR